VPQCPITGDGNDCCSPLTIIDYETMAVYERIIIIIIIIIIA